MKNTERLYQQIANSEGCSLITIDGKPYGVLGATINYGPRGSIELEVMDAIVPQWNGEGLPPVGTVCEFREYCGTWAECTIIGEFNGRIICGCNATGVVGYIDLEELRPIRTPEQIAADEREAAVNDMHELYIQGAKHHGGLYAIYDAGYRKQATCDPTGHDD